MNNDDDRLRDNPFADQLDEIDVEVSEDNPEPGDSCSSHSKNQPSRSPATTDTGQNLSDKELFRRAVEGLDDDEIPPPSDPGPPPTSDPDSASPASSRCAGDDEHGSGTESRAPSSGQRASMTDRELFQNAVDNLDPSEIYAGKFQGRPASDLPEEPTSDTSEPGNPADDKGIDEAHTRQQAQQLRDAALFEKMVDSVEPLDDRDKYRHRDRRRRSHRRVDDPPDASEHLRTPLLATSGEGLNYVSPLDDSQRDLIQRYERRETSRDVPVLNLRGKTRRNARRLLADFVARHSEREAKFLRIITGRGLQSKTDPVIKPTVLQWLHGPGLNFVRGYAPERTHTGDYGSLIVELASENAI